MNRKQTQDVLQALTADISNRYSAGKKYPSGHILSSDLDKYFDIAFKCLSEQAIKVLKIHSEQGKTTEERVDFINYAPIPVDLSGWLLNAGDKGQDYRFKPGTVIPPKSELSIYTLPGHTYSFDSHNPIWNDSGDTAFLFDKEGQLRDTLSYGIPLANNVYISAIQYDGINGKSESDEYIEVKNDGDTSVDISNWEIFSKGGQRFIFPSLVRLLPRSYLRVFTGSPKGYKVDFSFNRQAAVWNNKEDEGFLYDDRHELVSCLLYKDGQVVKSC